MEILKYYNINEEYSNTNPEMKIGDEFFINESETIKLIKTRTGYSIFEVIIDEFIFIDEYDTFTESYKYAKELEG